MKQISIIIADDHQLFRDGLKSLLINEKNIKIIGEASSGEELLMILNTKKPDIIISDISMPEKNGIEITKIITEKFSEIKVLILSMYINKEYIIDAIDAGAKGYLPKDISKDELLFAINKIVSGEEYFSGDIAQIALMSYIEKSKQQSSSSLPQNILTERELEIVKLVAEGLINKEISSKLNISVRTVDNHKAHIMQKLDLKSSIDIVKYAIKNEIINL